MDNKRILIIDDDPAVVTLLKYHLKKERYTIHSAASGESGLNLVQQISPHLVFQDVRLPGIGGIELLTKIKEIDPHIPVILITAFGGVKLAVESIKKGAYDFLTKPINADELKISVKNALTANSMQKEIKNLQSRLNEKFDFSEVIGKSHVIRNVLKQVRIVAPTQLTVILQGDSGTGKELFANLIHQKSARSKGRFVAIDCGAIPDTLVESELFGYEKGAFTGANSRKSGEFELADQGTLFLDEITNLPPAAQAKLLRVIQERKVRRIGSTKSIEVDVRLIAASNIKLLDAVNDGKFREDLYHRLNEFYITLPPLKDRIDDVPILAEHFLKTSNKELKKNIDGFTPEALKMLLNYHWSGNVRELKNVIRRAVLLAESNSITPSEIMINYSSVSGELDLINEMDAGLSSKEITSKISKKVEREIIKNALIKTGGNKTKAAAILKITRMTLYTKIKEFGL